MSTPLLQAYREGKLRLLWQTTSQDLIAANPRISPDRCKAIMAAILASELTREASELDAKVSPYTMSDEEAALYDWLYVDGHDHYRAELQEWSGTCTMLADMPDGTYEPEWMSYIQIPKENSDERR